MYTLLENLYEKKSTLNQLQAQPVKIKRLMLEHQPNFFYFILLIALA